MKIGRLRAAALAVVLASCHAAIEPAKTSEHALVELSPADFPAFSDDLSYASLDDAIDRSLQHFARLAASEPSRTMAFGDERVPASEVAASLEAFRTIIADRPSPDILRSRIQQNFRVFQSTGADRDRHVLFTGYYLPELSAASARDEAHPWPLYGTPPDLVVARAKDFPSLNEDLVGRVENGFFRPYPTRAEIAKGAVPESAAVAWVSSAIDAFFLEIQGSGVLRFSDGSSRVATFAGKNGRPYVAIGAELLRRGEISREALSMQTIRAWLEAHPSEREAVMNANPSFVFFRLADDAMGSLGVPVTAGRTIAADSKVFPKGALCFLETTRPNADGTTTPLARFALDQDTGGAIKTAAHVDVFFGAGSDAEQTAGHMKQQGRLFYLLRRTR